MAASSSAGKGLAWDVISLGTVAVLGILGVRRRYKVDAEFRVQDVSGRALNLKGFHCIVTGASSGIGAEVAWNFAKAGAEQVQMGCRSVTRCENTRSALLARCLASDPFDGSTSAARGPEDTAKTCDGNLDASKRAAHLTECKGAYQKCMCAALELTDPRSIRQFAAISEACIERQNKDGNAGATKVVLVNNAGIMGEERASVAAGSVASDDVQLWTNHYGHSMLTRLLLPAMNTHSCIAVVASRAHQQGSLTIQGANDELLRSEAIDGTVGFSRLMNSVGFSWYVKYARSKLCNVLFAAELRRRYPDGPQCVAISPGLVHTGLFSGVPGPLQGALEFIAPHIFQAPEEGAAHVLAGIAAALEGEAPLYWHHGLPQEPSAAAQDAELAEALWRASEAFCERADHERSLKS